MISKLISFLITFQLVFVFQIQNLEAGVGEKLQKKAHGKINRMLCGGEKSGVHTEVGCKGLDIVTNDPKFLRSVVNTVLLMTMSLNLLNSKCEKTDAGNKLKPRSITAGITHWIHKVASLIYIYAELQNVLTLRKLDSKYSKQAKAEGQDNKFRALLKIQKAKLEAAKKKQKILNIATMGIGAASAVELGMSAAYTGYGAYLKSSEAAECVAKDLQISSCAVPGATLVNTKASVASGTTVVANKCSVESLKEEVAGTLIKTAKSTVIKRVVSGVSAVVGGTIGKNLTEKAGGGKLAKVGGAAVGAVVGAKVAAKVSEKLAEAIMSSDDKKAMTVQGVLKECVEKRVKRKIESKAKEMLTAAAVSTSDPLTLSARVAVNCAAAIASLEEDCRCSLRNAKALPKVLKKIAKNLQLSQDLIDNEEMLLSLFEDVKVDEFLSGSGVTKSEDTCGVDYTSWLTRHDLECKSRFDFLSGEDTNDEENSDDNPDKEQKNNDGEECQKGNDIKDVPTGDKGCVVEVDSCGNRGVERCPAKKLGVQSNEGDSSNYVPVTDDDRARMAEQNNSNGSDQRYEEMRAQMLEEERQRREQQPSNDNPPTNKEDEQTPSGLCKPDGSTTESSNSSGCKVVLDSCGVILSESCPESTESKYNPFEKLIENFSYLTPSKTNAIHDGLKGNNYEKWAELLLNDQDLILEYRSLDIVQKNKLNDVFGLLTQALINLNDTILPSAIAQDADEFVSKKDESSLFVGLGVTAVGILIFPDFIKEGMRLSTVLQRNPIRRGMFYLATYFMAKENTKSIKEKINGIEKNIKALEEYMNKEGISLEDSVQEEAFYKFLNGLNFINLAHANTNVIGDNLVPLCIEGDTFSTKCTCKSTNSCGSNIQKQKVRSSLFGIGPLSKTVGAQISFVKKMSKGKVTESDYNSLYNSLNIYSKELNPEIAANNIDYILERNGQRKLGIVNRSKRLVASLKRKGLKQLIKKSGSKVDIKNMKINNDENTSSSQQSNKKSIKGLNQNVVYDNKSQENSPKKAKLEKAQKLDDFLINTGEINENKDQDIFQIINNRYKRTWLDNRLNKK